MSITCGFFNAIDHDRLYNATQMSTLFDGIINDGVFMNIGTAMTVKATGSMTVNVGSGRAWFDGTWTLNDAVMPITLEKSDVIFGRYDAVVLETNKSDAVRNNTIKIIKGAVAVNPVRPSLVNTEYVHQHPLAYVYVGPNVVGISQSAIENKVGTSACPYVTGILKTINADNLLAQWQQQYVEWYNGIVNRANELITSTGQRFNTAYNSFVTNGNNQLDKNQRDFDEWFNNLVITIADDARTHLQAQMNELYKASVEASEAIDDINSSLNGIVTYPKTNTVNVNSSNDYIPSAKAVYAAAKELAGNSLTSAKTYTDTVKSQMQQSFQAGVDAIYNACVAAGSTPSSKTPAAIADTISKLDALDQVIPGLSNCITSLVLHGYKIEDKFFFIHEGEHKLIINGGNFRYHTINATDISWTGYKNQYNPVGTHRGGEKPGIDPPNANANMIYLDGLSRGARLIAWNTNGDLDYNNGYMNTIKIVVCL